MLERASDARRVVDARNVDFCQADAERLPLGDSTVDVFLANGIFNLNPARDAIFGEMFRALKPGGAVFAAELILKCPLAEEQKSGSANWFS
jgi:ubiquinone/menaquinone biosynthesis C-methylase UbiE